MSHINLIPEQSKENLAIAKTFIAVWVVLACLAIVAGALFIGGMVYRNGLQAQAEEYKGSLDEFENSLAEFTVMKQEGSLLKERLEALQDLLDNRLFATAHVDFVYSLVEKDVMLTKVDFDIAKGEITLEGLAKNYEAIARQIVTLEANEHIAHVDFTDAHIKEGQDFSEESDETRTLVAFKATIVLGDRNF